MAHSSEHALAGALRHRLLDANGCLEGIIVSPAGNDVQFAWGCPKRQILTMECVFDLSGYGGFGKPGASAGWHCNRPLPLVALSGSRRISDVAVGRAGARMAWAACFIPDLAEQQAVDGHHRHTECYRLLLKIHQDVRRTGDDPRSALAEMLP
jgi:hypothetical protein